MQTLSWIPGKTTLLNLIMGKIKPLKGGISINPGLRIGHFTQHSSDNFDLKLSAVENLLNMFSDANVDDQHMRSFLGQFQIQNNDALKPMRFLSGGQVSTWIFGDEARCLKVCTVIRSSDFASFSFLLHIKKSRVAFAALAYKKPHVLIIDEGSNRKSLSLSLNC